MHLHLKHFVVSLILVLNFAWAKGDFVGGGFSFYFFLPMLSAQAGFEVAENLSLRGNLDSLLVLHTLSGDVLYSFPNETLTVYAGAGPDMVLLLNLPSDSEYPNVFFGVHSTVGAEYHQDSLGYFLEVQPGLAFLGETQVYLKTRIGVNVYF